MTAQPWPGVEVSTCEREGCTIFTAAGQKHCMFHGGTVLASMQTPLPGSVTHHTVAAGPPMPQPGQPQLDLVRPEVPFRRNPSRPSDGFWTSSWWLVAMPTVAGVAFWLGTRVG